MKKEFVYNFTKHALTMKFAMYTMTPRGNYSLKIYDTNSSEITRLIRNTWSNNFKMMPLVTTIDGEYAIDKVEAQNLADQFAKWSNIAPTNAEARNWLKQFGIVLSEDAFNELVEKGMWYKGELVDYGKMFTGKKGVFNLLNDYLVGKNKGIIGKKETNFDKVSDANHPFSDMSGVLKALATIEGKYTNQSMTLSFRDNGKSIFGLTPNKFATDRVFQLKQYDADGKNQLVEKLKKLSMSQQSYVLDLLETEPDFREKFGIDHIGITALKEQGSSASPYSSITDLSEVDHDLAKMTGLQDLKQGRVSSTVNSEGKIQAGGNGIGMRIGRMFLPTMSDKSQMLLLNTGVFDFFKGKNKSFEISSDGEMGFTPTLKNLLFNQLVKPELDRIAKFHSAVGKTNITGYNLGAQLFHFLPILNNIKDKSGNRIIELMATDPNVFTAEQIEKEFRGQIDNAIHTLIAKKVEKKKAFWDSKVVRDKKGDITKIKFFDEKYLSQTSGNLTEKYDLAMYDFVLNSMLANSNMYTLLAGDPAIYSQDKLFKGFDIDNIEIKKVATIFGKEKAFDVYPTYGEFLKHLKKLELEGTITEKLAKEMRQKIKPIPTSGTDAKYLSLSKDIGVNLGKRLALLIAPGSKLANSKGEKYKQIFLKDVMHMAENMEYLVQLYHGKEALKKVQPQFDKYKNATNDLVRSEIREDLAKKFPDLKDYFDIESTDAQEYSTVTEHIKILEDQGRIPDAKLAEIKKLLKDGKDLTAELLGFVLQPIKPVYTGQIIDEIQDVARTVYIKSSSFPLLPQMTKNRKLDALRIKMEDMEAESKGKIPVRASYQSANKVGSMDNPIDPFNTESLATAEESTLLLDRSNFRIQQDVPFKSDKQKEDKVSMGTQIFKLLFGDGMMDQDGFEINGKPYTGRELYKHFNDTFAGIIKIKKKSLYRELGLNDRGFPIDEKKSIEKIQQLLQKEAISKGYPRQDIESLSFEERMDGNNQPYYDFKLPLWLSSSSNKYESLLNAIVTNRLISQKMPGSSFVLASEAGMEMSETLPEDSLPAQQTSDVEVVSRYTNADVKANPNKIYVFGDNTQRTGTGGQAQIRNNENAFGIATKLQPNNSASAFMSDNSLEANKDVIDSDIAKIKADGRSLVFPKDGFGTGLAKLKEKAPNTYAYLKQRLQQEFGFNNDTGVVSKPTQQTSEVGVVSEANINTSQSRVVHIGDFKGGELKGVQDDATGKFTYAEVYVPSKFKNSKGELIDLFEQRRGGYVYLNETKEGLTLKEDMIDPELLTNFSFRTPTSSHVSASIIKIVGILPPESGDIMIVPKNFIKQKGLDFDVDKETAYQLWNIIDSRTKKITVLTEKHKEEALKRAGESVKNLELDTPLGRLLENLFQDKYTDILDDGELSHEQKIQAISDKFDQKLLENEFIRVHKAIYANPNVEVQKKINKVLSMSFANQQADYIDDLNNKNVDNSDFTILDDTYQKSKMELGAAGKLAIGVYSNYITFHSLVQQMESSDVIRLMEEVEGESLPQPKSFRLGNFLSDGKLGRLNALPNATGVERSIAEIFAEKQNTATDNEKEQVLGRVNVNGETINVDAILTLLGFDKDVWEITKDEYAKDSANAFKKNGKFYREASIPYLFLSQPIIKDYVKRIQENKAITSDYVYDAEQKIIDELKIKYGAGYTVDTTTDVDVEFENFTKQMSSKNLINEITGDQITPGLQMHVLDQFLQLNAYARDLSGVQGVVNTTSLGKSIIESNDKFNKLELFPRNKRVENIEKLIGDFKLVSEGPVSDEYFKVGRYYIKPTTPQGQIVVNGIVTGNQLWNQYFPYSDPDVQLVMKEIMKITNSEEKSEKNKIELQYEIFKEMKRYMNSNSSNGLFENSASEEREGLFIDSKDNQSVANYLNTLKNTPVKNQEAGNKRGAASIRDNKLINKFQYILNTNGEPSNIFYNNSEAENFDEDYLYNSMAEMVLNAYPLPDKNNKPYDTKMLVADLVAYAYAEGGVQEVIQFVKYVPIEYLESIGFNRVMQNYSPKSKLKQFKLALGVKDLTEDTDNQTHTFVKQYMQHNPEKAFRITNRIKDKQFVNKVFNKDNKARLESFTFNSTESYPKFMSRRELTTSKRKQDKESLYQHIGNGRYQRISILGSHGMKEYELGNENAHSLLDNADPVTVNNFKNKKKGNEFKDVNDMFKIGEGNTADILTRIKNYRGKGYKQFPKLVEFLMPLIKNNLSIEIGDTTLGGTETGSTARTSIDPITGHITVIMDKETINSNDHSLIARAFMHEFVHSVTIAELKKYFNAKGDIIVDKLPLHVERLNAVFNEAKKHLGPELAALKEKRRKHEKGLLPSLKGYTNRELEVVYGGTSIFEFVTIALTEPEFQKSMSEIKFKASNKSILHRFKVAVMNILNVSGINIKEDSITFESLARIMDFIEIEAESNIENQLQKAYKPNRYSTKEWREAQILGKEGGIEDSETKEFNRKLGLYDMPKTQGTKSQIDEIFENNVALQKIGSKEDYSKFLALTGGIFKVDIEGFENYKKGLTEEVLDSLPDICD